jgi:hypothetical protein
MRKPDRPKSGVIFGCAIYTSRPTMGSSRSSTLSTRSAKHVRPTSRASVDLIAALDASIADDEILVDGAKTAQAHGRVLSP